MNFQRAFLGSSYLLVLAGAGALWVAGGLSGGTALLYLSLAVLSAFMVPRNPRPWSQVLVVTGLVFCYLLEISFGVEVLAATIHFLLLISLYKLFTRSSGRDFLLLYFLSFALLLVSLTYLISVSFLIWLIVYFFLATLTLILFESRTAYERSGKMPFRLRDFTAVALAMTGLAVLLAIPIFLSIPRGSAGFFNPPGVGINGLSGFSDRVRLGDIGRILENPKIVMRITLDRSEEEVPANLKWRGVALDHYDGRIWRNTRNNVLRTFRWDANRAFRLQEDFSRYDFALRQRISYLEPFSQVVFGAREMVQMWGSNLSDRMMVQDGNGNYSLRQSYRKPLQYTLDSVFSRRSEQIRLARRISAGDPVDSAYLQLPPLDPRVRKLALQVAGRFVNPVDRALALEGYLSKSFRYSLRNSAAAATDPLAHFLFEEKAGHCEFFAAAQAVMMRSLGIPARVVNGFRRGEFNDWGNYFIVRQSDAHSWVEGYFPGVGWIDFDPTPRSRDERLRGWSAQVSRLLDALDLFWTELVTFDRFKQISFFQNLGTSLTTNWAMLRDGLRYSLHPQEVKWWGVWNFVRAHATESMALLLLALGGGVAFRLRRLLRLGWRRYILRQPASELAPEYYLELLSALAGRGLIKGASETPMEFGRRSAAVLHTPLPLRITEMYYRNRFGNIPLSTPELSQIYSGLRKLKRRRAREQASEESGKKF